MTSTSGQQGRSPLASDVGFAFEPVRWWRMWWSAMSGRRVGLLWAMGLAIFTVPRAYRLLDAGLDSSWLVGLSMAITQHEQWGTDIMWTYGPLGFADVLAYYYFGTWLIGLSITLLVHVAFFIVLSAYLLRVGARPWAWVILGAVFLLPVDEFLTLEYECTITALVLLYMAAMSGAARSAGLNAGLAGCLIGLLLMVKGTGIVASAALFGAFAVLVLIVRRPWPLLPLAVTTVATVLVLCVVAGQSPLGLYAYFRTSYEIISGYTSGVSVLYEYPVAYTGQQIAFGAIALISAGLLALYALLRRERELMSIAVLSAPVLFTVFKEGYVRFGGRQLYFYGLLTLIEALVVVCAIRPHVGWRRRLAAVIQPAAIGLVAAVLVSGVAYVKGAASVGPSWPAITAPQRLATYQTAVSMITAGRTRVALAAKSSRTVRRAEPLNSRTLALLADGTVDVYPWDIDIVYAYHLRWDPRPVLQSYAAYTPYLDHADAQHFAGAAAPDHLLLADREIDSRYLAYDEPETFRVLASRYRVDAQDGEFLVLSLRPSSAAVPLRALGTVHARIGEFVPVPPSTGGPVYASVRIPYSGRGQVMNLAFQASAVRIRFRVDGDVTPAYRFPPRVAGDGLFVSTYLANEQDIRNYLEGRQGQSIRAFQISADAAADYVGAVDITFMVPG